MKMTRFRVLGRVQGESDGVPLTMGSPQQQAVLAVLLLAPGHTSSMDDLVDALWPDDPPRQARTTVRTYVSRLRRSLGAGPDEQLVSLPGGYRLEMATAWVDAFEAERLVADAVDASSHGAPEKACVLLREALALWQGEPLIGVPGPFAARQRGRLEDLRLTLLEERLALDIALGRAGLCVSELIPLTQEHPLRERFYELLMRALCHAGRQHESLEVFRVARRLLVEELGVEPGPALTGLQRRILDGDPALVRQTSAREQAPAHQHPPAHEYTPAREQNEGRGEGRSEGRSEGQTEFAADPAPLLRQPGPPGPPAPPAPPEEAPRPHAPGPPDVPPRPAQLPPDDAHFTGREAAVEALCAALAEAAPGRVALRIGAVTGMGGAGKTALAVHVAHRVKQFFPAGQLYADLRGEDGPVSSEAVVTSFLLALGTAAGALPDGLAAKSALFRSLIDGRRLLVVLDNAFDSAQIRPLLPGASDCAVLVTSRAQLAGLPGVRQIGLTGFTPCEGRSLLERIIGADRLAGQSTATPELVAACGFLPLAVRIVASRLAARPDWTVRAMVDRLGDERRRIDELRVGDLAVRATFELGYRQLSGLQARAFRLVASVDCQDLGISAAAALLGLDEHRADQVLESLADVAMLESSAAGRYRPHDLLRAFARRKSEAGHAPEAAAGRTRLLRFLLAKACAAFEQAVPGDPIREALELHGPGPAFDDANAARAWATAEMDTCVGLAAQVAAEVADLPAEDQRATEELRTAVSLLIALTPFNLLAWQGQWAAGRALLRAAERRADRWAEGRCRFLCGNAALEAVQLDEGERLTRLAAQICRATGDTVILRQVMNDLGMLCYFRGRYEEASRCYDEAIQLARELRHEAGECATALNASVVWIRSGEWERAVRTCLRELDNPRLHGPGAGRAQALYVLGLGLHAGRRYTEAAERLTEALELWTRLGQSGWAATAQYRLADTLRALGRAEDALPLVREAVQTWQTSRSERESAQSLMVLARVLWALGDRTGALARLEQAYHLFAALDLPEARSAAAQLAAGEPDLSAY
ncbi:AfsR/SARP family transcriptional regulator [Streptacidiphilus albus]|uniref:AfsR/SARP family transcriptional regulator n=1 Tax=Streptacidiphilus albus TaxID=105425 RepID=UPI000B1E5E48|nr:BTAD domain-containing putative transcriptional regulator [Streptacidiphilus albus]